uniref:Uncharacterized protein n=1 Tax=Caenorhabditis japonica TaxID=281687 RepID=A0A8R1E3K5_CAEJA
MFRPICWLLLIFNVSANYLVTNGYSFSTECPLKNADTTNKAPTPPSAAHDGFAPSTSSKPTGDHGGYIMDKTFRFSTVCPPTTVRSDSLSSTAPDMMNKTFRFSTVCRPNAAATKNLNVDSRELEKNLGEAHREYRIQFKGITDMQEVIGINEVFTRAEEDCESIL